MNNIVIIGGGKGGTRVAQALREYGHQGSITLFEAEQRLPYDRPPLSKGFLTPGTNATAIEYFPAEYYRSQEIELLTGRSVDAIDRQRRVVIEADGTETKFDTLVLATGATARKITLPEYDKRGVHYLRSADDALALKASLRRARSVVIIGAGFIGLEVAATAVSFDCEVHVVEQSPVVLGRAVPPSVSSRVLDEHRKRGVHVLLNCGIERLVGGDQVEGVMLTDGRRLNCDAVIVGIGAVPSVDLAIKAGLAVQDGIVVDEFLRTSDPAIYALGDACRFKDSRSASMVRLESWRNADEQGTCVAANIARNPTPFESLPYFWSDQFDLTLQIIGRPLNGHQAVIRELTDGATIEFSLDSLGRITGASAFGKLDVIGKEIRATEHLIRRNISARAEQLVDPNITLKSLMRA